ncbi:MAG: CocE/NonD family hydrolase [Euryarchaeota archaeon]|nr:CocE/NonD family hydrolase [Euryarchaeota archaeon]
MARSFVPHLFVVILVLGGVAGCLDAPALKETKTPKKASGTSKVWTIADPVLSQALYPEKLFEHFPVTASDGVKLDNWLWRPKTPDDVKVPTIVHLSPYFANSLPRGQFDRWLQENFTARGYAVMAASVRGTGFSEGCFEIGGPRERQDYNELFAAIAKQPWSNGNVGLIASSRSPRSASGTSTTS